MMGVWSTRSRVNATVLIYVALSFLTRKSMETKMFIAVACLQTEIGNPPFNVTWLWRTRSRVKDTVLAHAALSFLNRETKETKKTFQSRMNWFLWKTCDWVTQMQRHRRVPCHFKVWLYRISCWERKAITMEAICKCTRVALLALVPLVVLCTY